MTATAFYEPTFDDLVRKILRDVKRAIPLANTTEGDYPAMARAVAGALLPIHGNGKFLDRQKWPDEADEVYLRKFGAIFGVAKQGDRNATGAITVTSSVPTTIPADTFVKTEAGVRFKTIGLTSIGASLTTTAYVIADQPGRAGNQLPGTAVTFESTPPSVSSSATVVLIDGGDDAWDNARWALAILKRMRAKAGSGNVEHLLALAHAVQGVEAAFVYPALRGASTVDVIVTASASSSGSASRAVSADVLARVAGAFLAGIQLPGGDFVAGIPEDVMANVVVGTPSGQPTHVRVQFTPSVVNRFEAWPPYGASKNGMVPGATTSWYRIASSPAPAIAAFRITKPTTGTVVAPSVGNVIGTFFTDKGYCKATVTSVVVGLTYWDVTVGPWLASDGEAPATVPLATQLVLPWNTQLYKIVGAPRSSSDLALSGAVGDFFAGLGPGEMTPLTADDIGRRCRFPRPTDTNPVTGLAEWPTEVTARLVSEIVQQTDAANIVVDTTTIASSGGTADAALARPATPVAAYLGTPPSILVPTQVWTIPIE